MKHLAASNLEAQLLGLSTLVQLIKRARHAATAQELAFVMVNETNGLVPYRQAVLWRRKAKGHGGVVAISGGAVVERNAPITLWLNRALVKLDPDTAGAPRPVSAADLSGALGEEWDEWLPARALWVPLALDPDHVLGGLLLAREQPWGDGERHIVNELADGFAQAWVGFLGGRRRSLLARLWSGRKFVRLAVAVAFIGAMFLPITLSALAPAEVVSFKPTLVRAPLEGVVDHFTVAPNAPVKEGQTLLELDPRPIQNKLDVARKALAVAEAEYRQAAQEALFDDKSRSKLTVLKARADQRRTDVTYAQSMLDRVRVTASRDGLALFDDPNDWIGRPVTIGERLLEIADPAQGELEIWLPVADAITLTSGADVEFFLNIAPGSPLRGKLRQASYEATLSPANLLGYRLKATLDDPAHMPRIGLRGTAKIYGEKVTLFYYLARRPLAAARQFLGL
jgi:multidrug efflux pump subunit AcrA (membrane-fusion protein)